MPILKETKHWYLPLDQYQDFIQSWILDGHKDWKPNVWAGKVLGDDSLKPRAVTGLDWEFRSVEGGRRKYCMWFDDLRYISSTKEWAEKEGKDWESFWKTRKPT